MKKTIGYPLPAGEAYTDELACMMVFYPDKPEYRQAFMGAYFYFGNWLAWERDAAKKGADAARAWKDAIEVTLGCIEMNTCETILSLLTEIRDNTGIYCCDAVDITDGDQYTDEVEDGVGDVPQNIIDAGYATGVSDWTGFDDYKCMISHVMVTNMQAQVAKLLTITDTAGAIAGGIAAVAAIAAVIMTGGGAVLVFGIVLAIVGAAGLYAAIAELGESGLGDLVDDMATNHDALACAIYSADGSAGAVVALQDAIDENFNAAQAILLKNLNISAQLKALYAGRYDAQDIADKMATEGYDIADYDCACLGAEYIAYLTVEDNQGAWIDEFVADPWADGHLQMVYTEGYFHVPVGPLLSATAAPGLSDVEIVRVRAEVRTTGAAGLTVEVTLDESDADETYELPIAYGSWHDLDWIPSSPVAVDYNLESVRFDALYGTGGRLWIRNIYIDFNVV